MAQGLSSSIHGVNWFPNFPDKFVTWGQEINLYEIWPKVENRNRNFLNFTANFIASESRYQYMRCVQPSYHKDHPIVAVGFADGKVGISDFHTADSGLEFTPRQQHMCTCLAWNELEPNLLAIGHDKHRSDTCITIWNIKNGSPTDTDCFFGHAESALSLCWDKNHRVLIAGMSQKQIRLLDLRQTASSSQPQVTTKCVYGLSVAPNGNYLCSFFDSVITLWDLRTLQRPFKQIQSSKNYLQLSWCPTRRSLLSALQRESPYITLYDTSDAEQSRDVFFIKKQLLPFHNKYHATNKGHALTSHSWHSTDFERALLLSDSGFVLDFKLPLPSLAIARNRKKLSLILQRPLSTPNTPTKLSSTTTTGNLNQNNSLEQSNALSTTLLHFEILDSGLMEQDLTEETRRRAINNYGLNMDFKHFGDLRLSPYLKNVWITLNNLYHDERLTGLKDLLGVGINHTAEALIATSREAHLIQEQRDKAIKLCGWSSEQDLKRFIATLNENKEFSRAAMICVFHSKMVDACNILSQAADASSDPSMFRIAAIALSSFNADRCNEAWRNQRSSANMQIQDAHLRATFSFLTTENEQFDSVLNEEGISLADRMSFACKYLSESKLADYVKHLIQKSIEKGDLNGLLLTGESREGINIFQAYLDATGDVQTVALLVLNYFNRELIGDSRIQYWISSYLDCLNSWRLWEKRAELEIKMEKLRPGRTARTVFLSCNFCGKSVSTALQDDIRMRSASSNVNKLSSCPSCRKPLPRCSLCLLHMGTTQNTSSSSEASQESLGWKSKPFSKWYCWCQTCRHGGHTEHILQWFKQNSECPVSSCSCRCFDLDANLPNNLRDAS